MTKVERIEASERKESNQMRTEFKQGVTMKEFEVRKGRPFLGITRDSGLKIYRSAKLLL